MIYSVEDDKNIQNVIQIALKNSGFDIRMFSDSKSFFSAMDLELPEIILLDIMLPGMDGISMMKKIKSNPIWNKIPIMMVSAKGTEIDKVIGLDLGADDYLTKPFGVLELVSRVKALLRRTPEKPSDYLLEIKGLLLNPKEYLCSFNETPILLTSKEFQLLKLLMQNHLKVVTRDDILNIVWGYDFFGETRTLDVHIKELRMKLSKAGIAEEAIQTVRGVGYKFIL
ncbi:MAG: response regulator transcription factor [Firmicutes bacterium]|nr:response regulator transcription factor [Bacillota bacterium]